MPLRWILPLSILRFLAVFLLVFLLLSPFITTREEKVEKPLLIIGQDNSASMLMNKDSVWYKTVYVSKMKTLIKNLKKDYTVDAYLFGSKVVRGSVPDFRDAYSDYGAFITKIKQDYAGFPIGALVIAGDGIDNLGINPVYAAGNLDFPVYALALGDTTVRKDLKILDTRYNSITYLGDKFPVEITFSAKGMKGKTVNVRLLVSGKESTFEKIKVSSNDFVKTLKFYVKALRQGIEHLKVQLHVNTKELNLLNNSKDLFITVLNDRQHILILASVPHPDVAAIRRSLKQLKNYKVTVRFATNFDKPFDAYNLIILDQLPNDRRYASLTKKLKKTTVSLLFLLGDKENYAVFNSLHSGLEIKSAIGKTENAQAKYNEGFSLFSFDKKMAAQIEKLPPLQVPFGNYILDPDFSVFAYQKIASLKTTYPLLAFGTKNGYKRGFVCGEGLWRWRLHDYLQNGNTDAFDELISQSVQYLMVRKDKRFFRVITKENYPASSDVILRAELYNPSYEMVNTAEVKLQLVNEANEKFEYSFLPDKTAYSLHLGRIPVGSYRYSASTHLGKKSFFDKGGFVVTQLSVESLNITANHRLFYRLAAAHDGKVLQKNEINRIPALLKNTGKLKKRISFTERYTGFFDIPLILFLIILLLSCEWFMRKYFGSY